MGFFSSEKDNNVRKQYNGGSSPRPAGNNNAVDDAMRSSYPQASREQEKPVVDVVDFHETTDDTLKSKHTSQPVNTVKTPAQGSAKKGETFFAKEVNISGTLNSSTDIIIEGVFEGPIHTAGDVTVRNGGVVKGDITASNVYLDNASIEGNIEATSASINGKMVGDVMVNAVTFDASAKFDGEVSTCGLEVKNGAMVHGQIDVRAEDVPAKNVPKNGQKANDGVVVNNAKNVQPSQNAGSSSVKH